MSVTPNFSWPLIEPTDFVTNLPADLELLADDIDADVWALDQAAIKKTIVDAKGDLIAATANDTVARVAVGTNGQVLTANSGATAGIEWSTIPTAAAPVLPVNLSGQWLRSIINNDNAPTAGGMTEDVTHYTPIYLPNCTLDRIAVRTGTHTSNGVTRLGIYQNSTNNRPGNLLLDAGTVSVTSAATYEITINQVITANWYWLAVNMQSGSYQVFKVTGDVSGYPMFLTSGNSASNTLSQRSDSSGYTETGVTGAFANANVLTPENRSAIATVRIA